MLNKTLEFSHKNCFQLRFCDVIYLKKLIIINVLKSLAFTSLLHVMTKYKIQLNYVVYYGSSSVLWIVKV